MAPDSTVTINVRRWNKHTCASALVVTHIFMSRNGIFFGGTVGSQEFVAGDSPRLNRILTFAFTAGWGP